ncbi:MULTISPECIES: alpha/beta fold hydrolase [Cupriavidus]|uniref:alpha/beta fold hydrolase n=1 Tax=Cupriavidus sp. DF5525 TaxID=3160989 RepID=UPI0032DE97F2
MRFAVEQGHTLFLMSWRNPDATCGHVTWGDYLSQGVRKAIEVALAISGADKLNALGWCVGGTMLSSALAVLRARADTSVASLTLLTIMLDFQDPGDLGMLIDEQGVASREQAIGQGGIYPGVNSASSSRRCVKVALRNSKWPARLLLRLHDLSCEGR